MSLRPVLSPATTSPPRRERMLGETCSAPQAEANRISQSEELEALAAIYGDEVCSVVPDEWRCGWPHLDNHPPTSQALTAADG